MSKELCYRSATELAMMIKSKDISSLELTQAFIDRIEEHDQKINAVVVRTFENALESAEKADNAVANGEELGPLHGVPMTIKESYVMAGTPSTWGIEANKDNYSDTDGLAVSRFKKAGAHFLGKTNVPKDLADVQSYNVIYGTTNNPWNLERVPGGSSGGSGAALAAGFSALEAGSDIGGSIRTPAHFCGVFGHKPTWGIIPMQGHEVMPGVPDADLSVCGPLARDASDLATALDVMAGPAGRDSIGWQLSLPRYDFEDLKDLKVAVWATDDMSPVSKETEQRVLDVAKCFEKAGSTVAYDARPDFDIKKSHITYQNLLTAVMSSAQPESFVEETRRKVSSLEAGDQSIEAVVTRAGIMMHRDWIRHNFRREKLRSAWDAFFKEWDVLICPQFNTPAFEHDQRPFSERSSVVDGEIFPYMQSVFWAGLIVASYLPSTVFPSGLGKEGLPIGVQVASGPYQDYKTIEVSRLISREIGGFEAPDL